MPRCWRSSRSSRRELWRVRHLEGLELTPQSTETRRLVALNQQRDYVVLVPSTWDALCRGIGFSDVGKGGNPGANGDTSDPPGGLGPEIGCRRDPSRWALPVPPM